MNVNTSVMTSWWEGKRQRKRRENRMDTGKTGNKRERERCMWGWGGWKRGRDTSNCINNCMSYSTDLLNHRLQKKLFAFIYGLLFLLFEMVISWLCSEFTALEWIEECIYLKLVWLILSGCLRISALGRKSPSSDSQAVGIEVEVQNKLFLQIGFCQSNTLHPTVLLAVGCALLRLAASNWLCTWCVWF